MKHVTGNLLFRWTDFLTTGGETRLLEESAMTHQPKTPVVSCPICQSANVQSDRLETFSDSLPADTPDVRQNVPPAAKSYTCKDCGKKWSESPNG
jgi:transposase-like protein